jgi:hypothetical protein
MRHFLLIILAGDHILIPMRWQPYQFTLIIRLLVLGNLRNYDISAVIEDAGRWFKENEREWRWGASSLFDYRIGMSVIF